MREKTIDDPAECKIKNLIATGVCDKNDPTRFVLNANVYKETGGEAVHGG